MPTPAAEKPIEPLVQSKPESPVESKDEFEKESAKPLVNGDNNADGYTSANGVTTDDVDMKFADPEKPSESSPPKPTEAPRDEAAPAAEMLEEVSTTEAPPVVSTATLANAPVQTAVQEGLVAEMKVASEPTVEQSAPMTSEDVEMADASNADESADPTPAPVSESAPAVLDAPSEQPTVQDASPAEPSQDVEMAEKPKDTDDDAIPPSEVDLGPASMSQLAIETTEGDGRPSAVSSEVSMLDAPSNKVAREREDDVGEEPAPKRAKTEPKEDSPKAEVAQMEEQSVATPTIEAAMDSITAKGPLELTPATLSELPEWNDEEKSAKDITEFQRREMRKVIGRIKKTKHGNSFRDSVQRLWPQIWVAYAEKVDKPMDLSEIDRNLRDGAYKTIGDFKDNLKLIFLNTVTFNGPTHDITSFALNAIRNTWEDVRRIPEEEPAKPKAVPKPKPVRESRAVANASVTVNSDAATRRQSAGPAASPARDAPEAKPQPAAPQPTNLRRASTATEVDRPKRTVRAPKPKDIDYSTKASRKKLKPELQFCEEVLTELSHSKNTHMNQWFMDPVDAEGLGIPHYYSIIKKPMDLTKVNQMLSSGEIPSLKDFDKNVRLVFTNCYDFNGPPDQGNAVSGLAKQLEDLYNSQMKGKDAWLSRHAKANARQASVSNASDDEDEDGDDEADPAATPGVDPSKEVKELEAKYNEEAAKLNTLILADNPVQSMVDIQQGILKVIQSALIKAKQGLSEYRQKQDKASKKGTNKKTKASGAAGRKPAGNAAPKKAGGSKKASKKSLTAADKDQIATAINDLDGSHLDRAIDIIKRDTNQNVRNGSFFPLEQFANSVVQENDDGELELEIDQLSNEALLKLWELCKKVLPGFGKDSAANIKSSPEVSRTAPPKQAANNHSSKSKKNKPMSAQEQEARIAQLQSLSNLYKPGQEPGQEPVEGMNTVMDQAADGDSSEDSSSEEE